jgi:hypothetical protein
MPVAESRLLSGVARCAAPRNSTMKRILFYSLAASAVCAMAMSNADTATRKHHPTGHYRTTAAKVKTVASRQLLVSEPLKPASGGRSPEIVPSIGIHTRFRSGACSGHEPGA